MSKCPKHNIEYVESEGAMRCLSQGCTHFEDMPAALAPVLTPVPEGPLERREEGRAERDEAFQMEQDKDPEPKPKKKKGK